eukprot:scaffold876_cov243-Pinguiococcus_pyrenoidosus.AAC.40
MPTLAARPASARTCPSCGAGSQLGSRALARLPTAFPAPPARWSDRSLPSQTTPHWARWARHGWRGSATGH